MSVEPERSRLAVLVHEVRSPVAALAAISETLADGPLEPEARRRLVQLAVDACNAIERLAADAVGTSVHVAPVDLACVVTDAVATAALRGRRVRAAIAPGLPVIEADAVRLRQVVDNLVANAAVHGGPEAEIVLRAYVDDDQAVLAVSDDGPGIPADEQRRIFEAGVRLDGSRPGSGLGLAVARAIADAHGAELRVESEPGKGSTFVFALPLEPGR